MSQLKNSFDLMGVINITPNSFSDGGQFNSLENFIQQVKFLSQFDVSIFDIGAESTAPFNQPVAEDEEISRFETVFIPCLNQFPAHSIISIDTYKPNVFARLYKQIKQERKDLQLVWNDVSGVIDDELLHTLKELCPECDYVYSHTGISSRNQTSFHMDYQISSAVDDVWKELYHYFSKALSLFRENGLAQRMIFDPCFGFSKSMEQNLSLIRDISRLLDKFSKDQRWLLGISRKSFLKNSVHPQVDESAKMVQVEHMHAAIISEWVRALGKHRVIIRLHDPTVAFAGKVVAEIFS